MQAGLRALNRAAGFIRSELSKRMTIRRVPELSFVIDETEMNGRHIDEIIARIHREEQKESEQFMKQKRNLLLFLLGKGKFHSLYRK